MPPTKRLIAETFRKLPHKMHTLPQWLRLNAAIYLLEFVIMDLYRINIQGSRIMLLAFQLGTQTGQVNCSRFRKHSLIRQNRVILLSRFNDNLTMNCVSKAIHRGCMMFFERKCQIHLLYYSTLFLRSQHFFIHF